MKRCRDVGAIESVKTRGKSKITWKEMVDRDLRSLQFSKKHRCSE